MISAVRGTSPEAVIIIPILFMILYLIILPYAFLMNTSHNKNQIIEHGWINVVKNMTVNNSVVASVVLCVSCKGDNSEGEGIQGDDNAETSRQSENNSASNSTHHLPICSSPSLRSDERNGDIILMGKRKVFTVLKQNIDISSHKCKLNTEIGNGDSNPQNKNSKRNQNIMNH